MNMKKTIAAVAAASVAVSAMATTASALEAKTLTYNLAREAKANTDAQVTVIAKFQNVALTAGDTVTFHAVGAEWGDIIKVSGTYANSNGGVQPINEMKATHDTWSADYSASGEKLFATWNNPNDANDVIEIPVVGVNDTAIGPDGQPAFYQTTKADITVTVTYKHLNAKTYGDINAVNSALKAHTFGVYMDGWTGWTAGTISNVSVPAGVTVNMYGTGLGHGYNTGDVVHFVVTDSEIPGTAEVPAAFSKSGTGGTLSAGAVTGTDGDLTGGAQVTLARPDMVKSKGLSDATIYLMVNAEGAWIVANHADMSVQNLASWGITLNAAYTPQPGDYIIITNYVPEVPTVPAKWTPADPATFGVIVAGATANLFPGDSFDLTIGTEGEAGITWGISEATGYTTGSYGVAPYMTDTATGVGRTYNYNEIWGTDAIDYYYGDIISYLETQPVNAGASKVNKDIFGGLGFSGNYGSYSNVVAVLNDAVQNYDVTFKFNTAAQPVNIKTGLYSQETWNSDVHSEYLAFGQHLYPLYDFELSTFTGMDWSGINLFAGALVVNGGLTMSLSNTEYFDWAQTSISFSWDDIVDAAAEKGITNDRALYISTMGLATSQTWFWDSMDVILAVREEEDVSADAGVEGELDTLDEDIDMDEDIDLGDDDGEEEVDVTPETEAPVVTEAAPAVAENPKTGNASVALAVIPVALAAAAVVAKKRG